MKTLLILFAIASTAAAQDFRFEQRRSVQFWYYESLPYNDYGYGYRPYFPMRRQQYVPPMQYVPMYWGSIPGYQIMGSGTNGYFIPGAYGW